MGDLRGVKHLFRDGAEKIDAFIAVDGGQSDRIVFGGVGALGMFLASAALLVQGGDNVGQHLSLLAWYLPGYSVTWGGAVLGALYGLVIGGFAGWVCAWTYNRIAAAREGGS